jgi:hypothetical protein
MKKLAKVPAKSDPSVPPHDELEFFLDLVTPSSPGRSPEECPAPASKYAVMERTAEHVSVLTQPNKELKQDAAVTAPAEPAGITPSVSRPVRNAESNSAWQWLWLLLIPLLCAYFFWLYRLASTVEMS